MSILRVRCRRYGRALKRFKRNRRNIPYKPEKQTHQIPNKNTFKPFYNPPKTIHCMEIDCPNMPPCTHLDVCLNNNKLKYKTNRICYVPAKT